MQRSGRSSPALIPFEFRPLSDKESQERDSESVRFALPGNVGDTEAAAQGDQGALGVGQRQLLMPVQHKLSFRSPVGIECGVQSHSSSFRRALSPTCRRRFVLPSLLYHHSHRLITQFRSLVRTYTSARPANELGSSVAAPSRIPQLEPVSANSTER